MQKPINRRDFLRVRMAYLAYMRGKGISPKKMMEAINLSDEEQIRLILADLDARFLHQTESLQGSEEIDQFQEGELAALNVTPDHPILTSGGWKKVSDLDKSDLFELGKFLGDDHTYVPAGHITLKPEDEEEKRPVTTYDMTKRPEIRYQLQHYDGDAVLERVTLLGEVVVDRFTLATFVSLKEVELFAGFLRNNGTIDVAKDID